MFLINWIREWKQMKREFAPVIPEHHCENCDTLRIQVEQLRQDNKTLLDRLLEKPAEREPASPEIFTPIKTSASRHVPWSVRRQMLETEDREKAKLLKNAPKPADAVSQEDVADLEREVGIAAAERESQAS